MKEVKPPVYRMHVNRCGDCKAEVECGERLCELCTSAMKHEDYIDLLVKEA